MPATARKSDTTRNLTLGDLMARFRCEDACRAYLERLRWPNGVTCPRCDSDKVTPIKKRNQYQCGNRECAYQFSVTAGTKLQDSKLPLWKWFLAAFLLMHAKKGISALQLKRMLGGSYETAWFLSHRIRAAMADVNERQAKLYGLVEIDETWVGGKRRQRRVGERTYARNQFDNKEVVMAAVEREGRVRLQLVPNRGKGAVHRFVKKYTDDKTRVYFTDDWSSYDGIADDNTEHHTIVHSKKEWVHGKVHTNTVEGVFSLLKRAIIGSHHKLSSKHLQSYLEEIEFKYNNRSNPYLFRETMSALMASEPMEYKKLIA